MPGWINSFGLALLWLGTTAWIESIAADWPQWRGPLRDGKVPEGELVPTKLPEQAKVEWHLAAGNGFSSPIVAAEKCFFMDNPLSSGVDRSG